MAVRHGPLDTGAVRAWSFLLDALEPKVVLDVGANYGEVTLSAHYPTGTEVHLVEANPVVADRLDRSLVVLEDAVLHRAAASDTVGTIALHVDRQQSGRSSIDHDTGATVSVQKLRIDDLRLPQGPLVFKIDVEGHEAAVLRGMEATLARPTWAGVVEVQKGGAAYEAPFRYALSKSEMRLEPIGTKEMSTLRDRCSPFTKDVVLSSVDLLA